MNTVVDELRIALNGRHPVLYVQSPEEDRILAALSTLLPEFAPKGKLATWTCVGGLDVAVGRADTRDPLHAIDFILKNPHEGFYVMKDLHEFLNRPEVVRAIRNAYHAFSRTPTTCLVIVSPERVIPAALEKEVCLVEVPLPDSSELIAHALEIQKQYPDTLMPKELLPEVALALRGLTLNETGHVIHRVFRSGRVGEQDILGHIFDEKKRLLKKAGFLEYVPTFVDVDNIGGMEVLKEWVLKRKDLFTHEAMSAGLPIPKGVLIMGISGCGKSLSAKAIASLWHLPLFRLDMNQVFSGMFGSPESAFHRALKAIESVSPAVLWIDEIESALGMTNEITTAEQTLTFSSFLTWMQERPPLVFVAATANRIESLPAEIIRKGRFDEVFFCDLPGENERKEIIRIHLKMNNIDPETIPIDRLLHSTKGWTGAEIEQAIIAGRIDAYKEGRTATFEDIRHHTTRMVPLSTTMIEQIRAIRGWSYQRATRASRPEPKSMIPDE